MNISNRIFAYPVLSSDKSDYKDSQFIVNCLLKPVSVTYLELNININLLSNYLQSLINTFKAEFVIHLECTITGYRKILKGSNSQFIENIPVSNLNQKFEIVAMIVTREDIPGFSCNEFEDDFAEEKFYVSKASILAYENMSYNLLLNQTEFVNGDSIFSISKDLSDTCGKMNVELRKDKIIIRLRPSDYQLYANLAKRKSLEFLFQSMLIFPALVYAIDELKLEGGINQYETTNWFQSLKRVYELKELDFITALDDENKNSIDLAQELMEYPIGKTFENLQLLETNMEED